MDSPAVSWSHLETLPNELQCQIVSTITDPRAIAQLLQTSKHLRAVARDCVAEIHGAGEIPAELVLQLNRVWYVEPAIRVIDVFRLEALAYHPTLAQATLSLDCMHIPNDVMSRAVIDWLRLSRDLRHPPILRIQGPDPDIHPIGVVDVTFTQRELIIRSLGNCVFTLLPVIEAYVKIFQPKQLTITDRDLSRPVYETIGKTSGFETLRIEKLDRYLFFGYDLLQLARHGQVREIIPTDSWAKEDVVKFAENMLRNVHYGAIVQVPSLRVWGIPTPDTPEMHEAIRSIFPNVEEVNWVPI